MFMRKQSALPVLVESAQQSVIIIVHLHIDVEQYYSVSL